MADDKMCLPDTITLKITVSHVRSNKFGEGQGAVSMYIEKDGLVDGDEALRILASNQSPENMRLLLVQEVGQRISHGVGIVASIVSKFLETEIGAETTSYHGEEADKQAKANQSSPELDKFLEDLLKSREEAP